MFDAIESNHMVDGTALDQETIIKQRMQIEDYVRDNVIRFDRTELYWNRTDDGAFEFQLHFFVEEENVNSN
jgi:hypothetical protein